MSIDKIIEILAAILFFYGMPAILLFVVLRNKWKAQRKADKEVKKK